MADKIIIALMLLSFNVNGQITPFQSDCGKWVFQSYEYEEWQTIDTLGKAKTNKREWVNEKPRRIMDDNPMITVFYPCGADPSAKYIEMRVCAITGIRQRRYSVERYVFVEKEKSDYEKTIDKFKE